MTLPKRNWMDMTWQDVAGAGADTARWIAVLPLAAVEQHGPHLPLGVDTYIGEGYLERVGETIAEAADQATPSPHPYERRRRHEVKP